MAGFGRVASRVYALFTRNPSTARTVLDHADLHPEDRVLEVGCGAGGAVELAAQRIGADRVAAVDPSPTFVDMVRRRVPGADVRVGGAEDVDFPDAMFSVIFSVASMHHWDDREAGLATVVGKLAPAGRLLIAERYVKRAGHGITPDQVIEVTAELSRLGQTDVHTDQRTAGRRGLMIISSTRP